MINFQKEIDFKLENNCINKAEVLLWTKYLHRFRQSLSDKQLNDEQLLTIFHAASSTLVFKCICTQVYYFSKIRPDQADAYQKLSLAISCSNHDMASWLGAIDLVFDWALKHQVQTNFIHVISYIQCAEQSPENNLFGNNLTALMSEMLIQYGHDGATN